MAVVRHMKHDQYDMVRPQHNESTDLFHLELLARQEGLGMGPKGNFVCPAPSIEVKYVSRFFESVKHMEGRSPSKKESNFVKALMKNGIILIV